MTTNAIKTHYLLWTKKLCFFVCLICFALSCEALAAETKPPDPQRFEPLHAIYSGKLSFLDGTPVVRCSHFGEQFRAELIAYPEGFVREIHVERNGQKISAGTNVPSPGAVKAYVVNKPDGKGYIPQDAGTDSTSQFFLKLDYPGRYALKLGSMNILEFDAVLSGDTLEVGLAKDKPITLPFNYLIKTEPNLAVDIYEPAGQKIKTWPGSADGLIAVDWPTDPAPSYLMVTAPSNAAPTITALKALLPEHKGDMNRRIIRLAAGVKGEVHHVINAVHVQAWASNKKMAQDNHFWLQIYDGKKQKGRVSAIRFPAEITWDTAQKPVLYLDEDGNFRAHFEYKDPQSGKPVGKSYQLSEGFDTLLPLDDDYPLFTFKGYKIQGTSWSIPNFLGIPFEEGGGNVISIRCQFSNGEDSASQSFAVVFDQQTRAYRFDPKQIYPALKGEASRGDLKDCSITVRGTTFNHYSHKDPLAAKKCVFMKHPEESGFPSHEACAKAQMEKAPVQMGFGTESGDINYAISLKDIQDSSLNLSGPINLKEGPYPELRYQATKRIFYASEAQARQACKSPRWGTHQGNKQFYCENKFIQKVCPQNYSWHLGDGQKVVVNYEALYCGESTGTEATDGPKADQLTILSPDTGRDIEIKAGAPYSVDITAGYQLVSAKAGKIDVVAQTATRKVFTKSIPVRAEESKAHILFPVTLADHEPILSVTLTLAPQGAEATPPVTVRYLSVIGPFDVAFTLDKPVPAHPKNKTEITFTLKKKGGSPIVGREFTVIPLVPTVPYVAGGWLTENLHSSTEVKTDEQGKVKIVYVPPGVVKDKISKMSDPSLFFATTQRIEFRDRANPQQKTVVEIPLASPYPKIVKLGVPGGDLAGTWQKNPSRVTIEDQDSDSFTIRVWGRGKFGYEGGHGYQEELVAENQKSPFLFRFQAEAMGFDITDLPDIAGEFGETNEKIFIRYAALLGGKKLLDAFWVRGSKMQKFIKTANGAEIPFTPQNVAKFEDRGFFVVNKMVTPTPSWAQKTVDVADYALGAQKNIREGADTYANQVSEQKMAGRDSTGRESTDVALDGLHTTVALLDTYQSLADLVNGTPLDPYSEALKIIYENAKTFYSLHRKFHEAAESWEDLMFIPVVVEVEDREGHAVRRMAKYAVKYSKKAGEN